MELPLPIGHLGWLAGAVALGFGAQLLRAEPRRLWAAAWSSALVVGAIVLRFPSCREGLMFFGMLFPGAQLAGALAFVRGRSPSWVAATTLLLALGSAWNPSDPTWISLRLAAATLALCGAGFVMLAAARRQGWRPRILGVAALLFAATVGQLGYAFTFLGEGVLPGPVLVSWVLILIAGVSLQLRLEDSENLRLQEGRTRLTQQELGAERERFRALTEQAFDLVAELDDDEHLTYVNPRYREVLGYELGELIGRAARDFLHPDDLAGAELFAQRAEEDGRAGGLLARVRRADGGYVWMEHVTSAIQGPPEDRRWVMHSRDATGRKQQEESGERARDQLAHEVIVRTSALAESEARFRALADHAPELISEFDGRGRYTFANESFRELLGIDPASLIGTTPAGLVHPDDLAASRERMARALVSEGPSHTIHRLRHADGSWRWFDNTGRAYRATGGELRFVSIGRDITEAREREAEHRLLQEHVAQAQRLDSLHVLAGGIAHDFNNLLAVILGNVRLLGNAGPQDGDVALRLRRIADAARHAEGLTQQLLAYAGKSVRKLRPIELSQLLRDTEGLLRAACAARCQLVLEPAFGLPPVDADETELRQVLLNLVANASEALGEAGGTVRVTTGLGQLGRQERNEVFGSPDREGHRVFVEVRDDGPGMDEATRRRILEPFYTTKGSGRGLGLAVVLGIATAHDALIGVASEPGKGSVFRLWLRPSRSEVEQQSPPASDAEAPVGRGTVLVVDDDDAVRELVGIVLDRAGFEVVERSGGAEALAWLRAGGRADCVLLDLAMPGLPGAQVLSELRELRPGLPVVVLTGFAGGLEDAEQGIGPIFSVLQKPFDEARLVETVGAAAAAGAGPTPP